jgi:hypothetical protein
MLFDINAAQGEWFNFFSSHIDPVTGEPVYEEPAKDARVQIRSMASFFEERLASRKRVVEHIYNPKTRQMERISYYPDLSAEDSKAEREDLYDFTIQGIEGFKDSKTGKVIDCTRENKIALMKVPVFDRFVARCQQLLASSGVEVEKKKEKN